MLENKAGKTKTVPEIYRHSHSDPILILCLKAVQSYRGNTILEELLDEDRHDA
jgi:hypothetical protein